MILDLELCWEPHDGQKLIKNALFGKRHDVVFLECGRKFGKALAFGTPVLTSNGYKPVEDIVGGDVVYSLLGKEQKVTTAHAPFIQVEGYRVTFLDKSYIDVDGEHLWTVSTKKQRKHNGRNEKQLAPEVLKTKDMLNSVYVGKEYNYQIPATLPIQFKKKDLPLDPYVYGLWLGDGHTHGAKITTEDQEIIDILESKGFPCTHYDKYDYGVGNLHSTLKSMGFIGTKKKILKDYLYSSVEDRIELLQGLMDTDGTINKQGNSCEFVQKNANIADSFYFLASSLGLIVSRSVKTIKGTDYHRLTFRPTFNCFKLTRKSERISPVKKYQGRTITSIKPIGKINSRCLTVSGDSKTFIVGNQCVATHNTETLAYLLYRYALSTPNAACYFIAPFQKQARELVWANNRLQNFFMPLVDPKTGLTHKGHNREEASQILEELSLKYGVKINESEMRIKFGNGSFIKLDGADNHQAYRGVNPHLIVYDEFKDHHPKFHIGMDPNLATFQAPLIVVGTPCEGDEDNEETFNSLADYAKGADNQSYFQLPTAINPHIDKEWLKRKRAELFARGEEDKWYREYCAMRVKAGQKSIFPMLSKKKHVISESDMLAMYGKRRRDYDIFCGFDPASSSTFAVVLMAINKYDKRILILDEVYETDKMEMSTRPIWLKTEKMLNKWNILQDDVRFIYDAAATWFANELNDKFGINPEPSHKDIGRNKEKRLSLIKDCLNLEGCIYFNESTVKRDSGIFWEMQNYRVDDKGKIPKENDHAIDTFRYILSNAHYDEAPHRAPRKDPMDMRRGFTIEEDWKGDNADPMMENLYNEFYE